MTADNKVVVDLNKVQYASYYYINQYGNCRRKKPTKPTVAGSVYNPEAKHAFYEMTMGEFAMMQNLNDVWTPVLRLQLTANHSLKYTGTKAVSIWKEWNRKIFKRKDK